MSNARNLARIRPTSGGLITDSGIELVSASKLTGKLNQALYPSGDIVQVVTKRHTGSASTSSGTLALMYEQSIVTKTASPTLLVYMYCKHRCDIGNGSWNLAYFQIWESTTSTQVAYSGYNGSQSNWIHDYTTEKPFYASGPAGTTYNFQVKIASYSGTHYMNSNANSSDDQYAILRIIEVAA